MLNSIFAVVECGDVYPRDSFPGASDCGDGVVNEFDILEEMDFLLGTAEPSDCQKARADMPNGKPPYCGNPSGASNCESDGRINIFDVLVINDKALGRANCCDYCFQSSEDFDRDGIINPLDNCPETPNGMDIGTCTKTISGVVVGNDIACTNDGYCKDDETCQMEQGDWNQNGVGDVCECYADFNEDGRVDMSDIRIMRTEFYLNCRITSCQTDIDGSEIVDFDDLLILRQNFGRTNCLK